jgi:hypothetical protein
MSHSQNTSLSELSRAYLEGRINREVYVAERARLIDEITGDVDQADSIRIDRESAFSGRRGTYRLFLARPLSIWLVIVILLAVLGWYYLV